MKKYASVLLLALFCLVSGVMNAQKSAHAAVKKPDSVTMVRQM